MNFVQDDYLLLKGPLRQQE